MKTGIYINGIEQFEFALKNLGRQGEAMSRRAIKEAAKPMLAQYRSNAAKYSKTIARAIGFLKGRNRPAQPVIGIGVRLKQCPQAWYAHILEFGASGIKRTKSRGGKKTMEELDSRFLWVSRVKKGQRYRVDLPARPFARPAIESTKEQVKEALAMAMQKEIEKALKK